MADAFALYALVVEDDALLLMFAADVLAQAGFCTLEAPDGDTAKPIIDAQGAHISLLFTDVQMPGDTDGFALARYVAMNWPDIEIVVASGGVQPGPGDLPERATFIAKPLTSEVVLDHLRAHLPDGKKPKALRGLM